MNIQLTSTHTMPQIVTFLLQELRRSGLQPRCEVRADVRAIVTSAQPMQTYTCMCSAQSL